jgi:hypothetical protein
MNEMFSCGACHKKRSRTDSGMRLILGVQTRVCNFCKGLGKMGPRTKKRKWVGADGVVRSNTVDPNWTSSKVKPTQVAGYPGHDIRTHVPDTFVGEYTKEWRRLRGET